MASKFAPIAWLLSAACALACFAAAPIPREKRVAASIVQTIAAPDSQPMHMPTDVAIDSHSRLYVVDGANDRILQFAPDGKLEQTITKLANEQLKGPVGVFVDARDGLWIADTANHRLLHANADATHVESISPKVDGPTLCDPTDIAITADGKRTYVVDNDNHRILSRDNATGKWSSLGTPGRALGQFQWPFMICIDPANYVYVTEAIGSRVQHISPTDRWAGQIGRWGIELGQFYRPKGIAIDALGRIFVNDSTLGVIQVFSARGAVEGVLTDKDGQPLRFEHPMGMSFDAKSRLYVVEMRANRVAVLSIAPESP